MHISRRMRYGLIGALVSALTVFLLLGLENPTVQAILRPRDWTMSPTFPVLLWLIGTALFAWVAQSYDVIDLRLPGETNEKAIFYSLTQALIVLLYAVEPLPHRLVADYLLNTLKIMIVFLAQAILIKYLTATKRLTATRQPFIYWRAVIVYAISFFTFRWIAYHAIGIYAEPSEILAVSGSWAFLFGGAIGFVFCLLQRFLAKQKKAPKALQFTFRFFTPLCVSYHVFFGSLYALSLGDLLARVGLDVLAILTASFIVVQWQVDSWGTASEKDMDMPDMPQADGMP